MIHTIRAGTVKRLHVNRQIMSRNAKNKKLDPNYVIEPYYVIQTSKGSITARWVEVVGSVVADINKPQLSCGARAYYETRSEVRYKL